MKNIITLLLAIFLLNIMELHAFPFSDSELDDLNKLDKLYLDEPYMNIVKYSLEYNYTNKCGYSGYRWFLPKKILNGSDKINISNIRNIEIGFYQFWFYHYNGHNKVDILKEIKEYKDRIHECENNTKDLKIVKSGKKIEDFIPSGWEVVGNNNYKSHENISKKLHYEYNELSAIPVATL